jgi:type II secretory pathway component PulL
MIFPYISALADFRARVRQIALTRSPKDLELLELCGVLRDRILPEIGVRIEDKFNTELPVVKLMDEEDIRRRKAKTVEKKLEKVIFLIRKLYVADL